MQYICMQYILFVYSIYHVHFFTFWENKTLNQSLHLHEITQYTGSHFNSKTKHVLLLQGLLILGVGISQTHTVSTTIWLFSITHFLNIRKNSIKNMRIPITKIQRLYIWKSAIMFIKTTFFVVFASGMWYEFHHHENDTKKKKMIWEI